MTDQFFYGNQSVRDWPLWRSLQPPALRRSALRDDRGHRYRALERHPHEPRPRVRWTGTEFQEVAR